MSPTTPAKSTSPSDSISTSLGASAAAPLSSPASHNSVSFLVQAVLDASAPQNEKTDAMFSESTQNINSIPSSPLSSLSIATDLQPNLTPCSTNPNNSCVNGIPLLHGYPTPTSSPPLCWISSIDPYANHEEQEQEKLLSLQATSDSNFTQLEKSDSKDSSGELNPSSSLHIPHQTGESHESDEQEQEEAEEDKKHMSDGNAASTSVASLLSIPPSTPLPLSPSPFLPLNLIGCYQMILTDCNSRRGGAKACIVNFAIMYPPSKSSEDDMSDAGSTSSSAPAPSSPNTPSSIDYISIDAKVYSRKGFFNRYAKYRRGKYACTLLSRSYLDKSLSSHPISSLTGGLENKPSASCVGYFIVESYRVKELIMMNSSNFIDPRNPRHALSVDAPYTICFFSPNPNAVVMHTQTEKHADIEVAIRSLSNNNAETTGISFPTAHMFDTSNSYDTNSVSSSKSSRKRKSILSSAPGSGSLIPVKAVNLNMHPHMAYRNGSKSEMTSPMEIMAKSKAVLPNMALNSPKSSFIANPSVPGDFNLTTSSLAPMPMPMAYPPQFTYMMNMPSSGPSSSSSTPARSPNQSPMFLPPGLVSVPTSPFPYHFPSVPTSPSQSFQHPSISAPSTPFNTALQMPGLSHTLHPPHALMQHGMAPNSSSSTPPLYPMAMSNNFSPMNAGRPPNSPALAHHYSMHSPVNARVVGAPPAFCYPPGAGRAAFGMSAPGTNDAASVEYLQRSIAAQQQQLNNLHQQLASIHQYNTNQPSNKAKNDQSL